MLIGDSVWTIEDRFGPLRVRFATWRKCLWVRFLFPSAIEPSFGGGRSFFFPGGVDCGFGIQLYVDTGITKRKDNQDPLLGYSCVLTLWGERYIHVITTHPHIPYRTKLRWRFLFHDVQLLVQMPVLLELLLDHCTLTSMGIFLLAPPLPAPHEWDCVSFYFWYRNQLSLLRVNYRTERGGWGIEFS